MNVKLRDFDKRTWTEKLPRPLRSAVRRVVPHSLRPNRALPKRLRRIATSTATVPGANQLLILSEAHPDVRQATVTDWTPPPIPGPGPVIACRGFQRDTHSDPVYFYQGQRPLAPPELQAESCHVCGDAMVELVQVVNRDGERAAGIGACRNCATTRQLYPPTPEWLEHFYANEWDSPQRDQPPARRESDTIYKLTHDLLPARAKVLEVGCGFGDKLLPFAKAGHEVLGVDLSKHRADYVSQRLGLPALNVPLEKLFEQAAIRQHRPFDLAGMFHVLEHIRQPTAALGILRELVGDTGHLYLAYPNLWGEALVQSTMFVLHTHSFSPWTSELMLHRAGFQVVRTDHSLRKLHLVAKACERMSAPQVHELANEQRQESAAGVARHFIRQFALALIEPQPGTSWGIGWNPFQRRVAFQLSEQSCIALTRLLCWYQSDSLALPEELPIVLAWDRGSPPVWVK